jgi:PAS domain S-box-containing protein
MSVDASQPVTLLASIAHRLAERRRVAGRAASRRLERRPSRTGDQPSAPDVARLFDLPFDVMGVASFDGVMRRVNPGIKRVLGLAPEEVVGRPLLDMCHPDDREATAAAFGSVLESGELSGFENRLPAADGSYRWLQWNVLADADEGLIYGVARDVTERRNAEQQLRKTQRELETSRDALRALADEQAALRRVATLVAKGAAPTEVFGAVSVEVARLLGAAQVSLVRYESEPEVLVLAMHGQHPAVPRAGMRLPLEGDSVTERVLRTGRSARINYGEEGRGTIAEIARRSKVNVTVGAPITVEGRLWGVIPASWEGDTVPPVDAEERLTRFAELLDTAVGNADSRDQLTASRARVLTAGDEARRRVVRDLHDGAQQRLVHTIPCAEARAIRGCRGPRAGGGAPRRGARPRGAEQRGASRAGARDSSVGPDARWSPRGRRCPRFAYRRRGRRGRHQHAAAACNRGQRVLHRGRGADERRQALAGWKRTGCRHGT